MPQTDISSADYSALSTTMDAGTSYFSVNTETTDANAGEKEYSWAMDDWSENLGYYKNIPELKSAIDAKAIWTMGNGFEADEATTILLYAIKGHGKDSFNTILTNQTRVKDIAGDSFAEIIRDKDEVLANLKPLDPSTIRIISNGKGIIKRYEQFEKVYNQTLRTFQPDEMFHLSRERIADEIHGISVIPSVKWIIDARNEAMADWKRVLHRNIDPLFIFHLDTDDTTQIAAFKAKNDAARASGENMYIPKGAVVPELVATATNASLNPLTWINQLNDYFYQAVNVPQIIIGNSKEFTDASSKIAYLAFEQNIKAEQRYLEEQVLSQLNIDLELTFPAKLENEALSDQPSMELEQEPVEPAAQQNDMTAEMEGKK